MDQATSALQGIPFEHLIGGPLNAAVSAQALAAKTSVDFIRSVGFNEKGEVNTVKFVYQRDGRIVSLDVPLLTIVPIPYLRIDDMTINFKAQLSASGDTSTSDSTSLDAKANLEASGGFLGQRYKFNASVSAKKDSSSASSSKYSIEYTMDISVHAVQDDIPKGLATVLGLLGEQMKPVPQGITQDSINAAFTAAEALAVTTPRVTFAAASVALKDASGNPVPGVPVSFDLLVDGKLVATTQGKTVTNGSLESDLALDVPDAARGQEGTLRLSIEGRSRQTTPKQLPAP
jgi:hypothetical protein